MEPQHYPHNPTINPTIEEDSTGTTTSLWMATTHHLTYPRLESDLEVDICVVGGGIAGLTTAYYLALAGKSVAVIDSRTLGGGETARTTAHLSYVLRERYYNLEKLHGFEKTVLVARSHLQAINEIEHIVTHEGIQCDFERLDGFLFLGPTDASEISAKEHEILQRMGLIQVQKINQAHVSSWRTRECLRFPNQAQFHPLNYLNGLAEAIQKRGGKIFGHTKAVRMEGGEQAIVHTVNGHRIKSQTVVVATNTPVNDWVTIHTKQAAYRTYAIGIKVPWGSISQGLYWDTENPYHYVRLQTLKNKGHADDILIVGGEDHKTGQGKLEETCFRNLEVWAQQRFPQATKAIFRWSGQVMESVDGLAFIGRNPGDHPNVLIATGDCGNGMTHGTIAGMLLRDLILGKSNPYESVYDPARITIKAAKEFASENLNVAKQFGSWATPGDVNTIDQILPGQGAVIRDGLKKVAVFKDEHGDIHKRTAVCPHLGCIVDWNNVEKTWDCPCHGSRFDCMGKVLNGPALANLEAED